MIRINQIFLFILGCLFTQMVVSQQQTQWVPILAAYKATQVAEAPLHVFAVADGTLLSYHKQDKTVRQLARQDGLSDVDVSLIKYDVETKSLLIIYENSNIDIMDEAGVTNLPFLKSSTHLKMKGVHEIEFFQGKAYLSADFGVLVIDIKRREVLETYLFNDPTFSVAFHQETIYAATLSGGVRQASFSSNLLDPNSWSVSAFSSTHFERDTIKKIAFFKERACFFIPKKGAFFLSETGEIKTISTYAYLLGMRIEGGRLILISPFWFSSYPSLDNLDLAETAYQLRSLQSVSSLKDDGLYWVVSAVDGLIGLQQKGYTTFERVTPPLNLEGPKRNLFRFMRMEGKQLVVAGGGWGNDRLFNPGTFMTYQDDQWNNFDETEVSTRLGYFVHDYTGVAVDPDDPTHYFVSTYGEGVLEFLGGKFVKQYSHHNSALQPVVGVDDKDHYVRVSSVCYDQSKYLWMMNSGVQDQIVVRNPNGKWTALRYHQLNKVQMIDKMLITSKGHKWINIISKTGGLFVLDDNGTPDNVSDDKAHLFESLYSAGVNSERLEANEFYCLAEGKNGELWVGTNRGVLICSSPQRAIEQPDKLFFSRIIRTNEENNEPYYFLNSERVNAIVVDHNNRKWIGTDNSGLFLLSSDGSKTIHEFTTANSPLLSNRIVSLALDEQRGTLFIGTDKGLITFHPEEGGDQKPFSDVYAYPNPVRPDYDGFVTIKGLLYDSSVRITDVAGNLIAKGEAASGEFTWNCRTRDGRFVATGIYLVMAASSDGKESIVTKIAVVR